MGKSCVCCLRMIPDSDRERYLYDTHGPLLPEQRERIAGPTHCSDCADWRASAVYRGQSGWELPPWALPGPREQEWE